MNEIKYFLQKNNEREVKVAVVGDCMVDQFHVVNVSKISPEFPISTMVSPTEEPMLSLPGGAGNVVTQSRNFNADTRLFGFIDEYTKGVLEHNSVRTNNCISFEGCKVPIKKRLYNKNFPLCRWDIEQRNYGCDDVSIKKYQRMLYDKFLSCSSPDVVIISDYDKGVFALDDKHRWVKNDFPTIVDPKKGPLDSWEGCYVFKLNNFEGFELSGGITRWQDQCKYFQKVLRCKAVVITHGDMVNGIIDGKLFEYCPKKKVEVRSTIGAGDCFAMILGLSIAHKIDLDRSLEESIITAFEAGRVYVQRQYNTPLAPHELLASVDLIEAKMRMPEVKDKRNYRLVVTNGCYDLLHSGHLSLLQHAKSLGDKLCVAINSDISIKIIKGESRPIIPLKERMKLLSALSFVDFVVAFDEDTPYNLIKLLRPEVLIKGSDWEGSVVGSEFAGETVIFPLVDGLSTTRIIEKIKSEILT